MNKPPAGIVTWLALLDVATGGLLYLRPFIANVNGLVFERDPITAGGTAGPASAAANPFRTSVTLPDLNAPARVEPRSGRKPGRRPGLRAGHRGSPH